MYHRSKHRQTHVGIGRYRDRQRTCTSSCFSQAASMLYFQGERFLLMRAFATGHKALFVCSLECVKHELTSSLSKTFVQAIRTLLVIAV
jgi:hypothetical protein